VSKARQQARAERQRIAAQRAEAVSRQREKVAALRAKRERRSLMWRRLRLWQHGSGFRRNRERWGALAALAMGVLLVVYFLTGSVAAVLGTLLVLVIAGPVLVLLVVDRSRS
jgi:Flp pilus assembly protein TadB